MKYDFDYKLQVVMELLSGKSQISVARAHGICHHEVRWWLDRYNAYGEEGLRTFSSGAQLSAEEKERIVLQHVNNGVTLQQLCLLHDVHRSTLRQWIRKYRIEQAMREGMHSSQKSKKAMPIRYIKNPKTELERLEMENLRLRAEIALIKKVRALVLEQEKRASKSASKPSKN